MSKISLSICDQGLFSITNFLLNLLLIRWLSPSEYGSFAIAFALFLLMAGFYNALILEPMSVLGPTHYESQLPRYLIVLVKLHIKMTLGLSCILGCLGMVYFLFGSHVPVTILCSAISAPLILCLWLARRACYLCLKPAWAVVGSGVYSMLVILLLSISAQHTVLTSSRVFAILGIASLASFSVLAYAAYRKYEMTFKSDASLSISLVWDQHVNYGRWAVGSTISQWISASALIPLLGVVVGNPQVAGFRAIQSLVSPMYQCLTAISQVLLPCLAKQSHDKENSSLRKSGKDLMLVNVVLATLFLVFLMMFGPYALEIICGQGFYAEYVWLLPYFSLIAFLTAAGQSSVVVLMASQRSDSIFIARCARAFVSLGLGGLMSWNNGMVGAMLGLSIGAAIETLLLFVMKSKVEGQIGLNFCQFSWWRLEKLMPVNLVKMPS